MIGIASVPLPPDVQTELDKFQADIDKILNYSDRVKAAEQQFVSKNQNTNPTFREIRRVLTSMCAGERRCMYCEDSVADEVEHIKPKSLYPEEVFVWLNYLYACGPCNGPKRNKFEVYSAKNGRRVDVTRGKKALIQPPTAGHPLLIDPRREDPLNFMLLDLSGTFFFGGKGAKNSKNFKRAEYTIDLLGLNRRDYLVRARRVAAFSYSVHLRDYINRRDIGDTSVELANLITVIQSMSHPTVWREMQRQKKTVFSSDDLFAKAPEALTW